MASSGTDTRSQISRSRGPHVPRPFSHGTLCSTGSFTGRAGLPQRGGRVSASQPVREVAPDTGIKGFAHGGPCYGPQRPGLTRLPRPSMAGHPGHPCVTPCPITLLSHTETSSYSNPAADHQRALGRENAGNFVNHTSNMGLVSRKHKEPPQLNNNKLNSKMGKDLNGHASEGNMQVTNEHVKRVQNR